MFFLISPFEVVKSAVSSLKHLVEQIISAPYEPVSLIIEHGSIKPKSQKKRNQRKFRTMKMNELRNLFQQMHLISFIRQN